MNDALICERNDRVQRAIDGVLSPGELALFQGDVLRDPELRAAYAEHAWLHGALHAEGERLPHLLERVAESPRVVRWPWLAGLGLAAAAALVFAFLGGAPGRAVAVCRDFGAGGQHQMGRFDSPHAATVPPRSRPVFSRRRDCDGALRERS